MANTNAPFGFRQYQGTGSAPTYEQVPVKIAYNATNIFFGDPVEPDANGYVVQGDGTTAAAGIAGIFVGCQYLSVAQKRTVWSNYWPGSDVASTQTVTGYIVNDPNAKFVVQSDATGIVQGDVNLNVGYTIGTGNTSNGISGAYISGTESGAYNWVVVAFNNVATKSLTGI